ncbi:MAG: FliH/SctL family protein [Chlamydiales bacterium]
MKAINIGIIRGEKVEQVAMLSPNGELIQSNHEAFTNLIEEECKKAFQNGHEKGERIGYQKALDENQSFLHLLQKMAHKILEQKNHLLDLIKPEIIEFIIAICERVIRKELNDPDSLVQLINSLLNSTTPSLKNDVVHIVLSSEDFMMLDKSFDKIQYDKREIKHIRFTSDPLMRQGDCRIETKTGLLNYDISRELANFQEKVLNH